MFSKKKEEEEVQITEGETGDALPEPVEKAPVVTMSPGEIESRYQAFLEKIKRGGK